MNLIDKSYIGKNNWNVDTKMYFHQDVKEAVLEFRTYIINRTANGLYGDDTPISIQEILEKHKELFGDFNK